MDILNLGCGNRILVPKPGETIINHDRVQHRDGIQAVHDLDVRPWPWADNSLDFILASSVFEHLKLTLVESLDECWRILRPGGRVRIKVPYWRSDNSYCDPTHRWFFSLGAFDQFDPDTKRGRDYSFYTERKWRIVIPAKANKEGTSIIVTMEVRKPSPLSSANGGEDKP